MLLVTAVPPPMPPGVVAYEIAAGGRYNTTDGSTIQFESRVEPLWYHVRSIRENGTSTYAGPFGPVNPPDCGLPETPLDAWQMTFRPVS